MIPDILYKYSPIDTERLATIISNKLYFSKPEDFNDPLDTKPTLYIDLNADAIAKLLEKLSLKKSKNNTSKELEDIRSIIENIRFNSMDQDYVVNDPESYMLGLHAEDVLSQLYNSGIDVGITCFSAVSNDTLMWSHYGDKHKGICAGYSVPKSVEPSILEVKYSGTRQIAASKIAAMLEGDKVAENEVYNTVLATKGSQWSYEKEWRLIGTPKQQNSPLNLDRIVFGLRCPDQIKYVIIMALENRDHKVDFYEIKENRDTFNLNTSHIDPSDVDEMRYYYSRKRLPASEAFAEALSKLLENKKKDE